MLITVYKDYFNVQKLNSELNGFDHNRNLYKLLSGSKKSETKKEGYLPVMASTTIYRRKNA
jgi:hypothetical protein